MRKTSNLEKAVLLGIAILMIALTPGREIKAQDVDKSKTNRSEPDDPMKKTGDIKVTFDEKDPNIMIVESNGERLRVNTVTKTVQRESPLAASTPPSAAAKPVAADEPKEDLYAYETGEEPFDYRVVNIPTPKKVPKGTWNISFTHRFSQPLQPFNESARSLLGFDSMSASSFGVSYGITDKFYVSAYRSPICQTGLCRTIEVGLGYHFADQGKRSPLAVSAYASVEGNDNFTEEYTYNLQAMLSRRFGKRLFLFFSPAIHLNSNGQHRFNPRPEDYFPAAAAADTFKLPKHGASFGMGASLRITPNVMALFEFTPRTGFKLGRVDPVFNANFDIVGFKNFSEPEMGLGLQYNIGRHSFTLTFSNTQTTTTSRYNSSNLVLPPHKFIIGFNLFRRW